MSKDSGKVINFSSKGRDIVEEVLGDLCQDWPAAARKELAEIFKDSCERHQLPPLTFRLKCGYTQEQVTDIQRAGTELLLEINRRYELLRKEQLLRLAYDIACRHGVRLA